jgi:UDP-N-acetylglucosamine 2-epimerase (non-hydrolysing)
MKTIMIIVGARPNFVKLAPIVEAVKDKFHYRIVHTGQHYDDFMSNSFFKELGIPEPDVNLEVKGSYPTRQTCKIMDKLELLCYKEKPNCMMVVGDVTSTLAGALVASKMDGIKLAHVEAGERSYDRSMPEEINRVITDHLSDFLFCTNNISDSNLQKEGIDFDRRFVVGNVMIDNLIKWLPDIESFNNGKPYCILTLHRAGNVDNSERLENILKAIHIISDAIPVKFPVHPRTKSKIEQFGFDNYLDNVEILNPMGYIEFLQHVNKAKLLLTDSGGAQIESAFLGTKCITLRDNTEHLCTLQQGCNVLTGSDPYSILENFELMMDAPSIKQYDPLWDGKSSERISSILENRL